MSKIKLDKTRPIFIISDLHMGDQGPRDNFEADNKEAALKQFLSHVKKENGQLIILGDLFEFWKANMGKVLVTRRNWIDRFDQMQAIYMIGNHDIQLEAFIGSDLLAHPFFSRMTGPFIQTIGGKKIKFLHGHEVEPFQRDGNPGWGTIFTIIRGIIEDKKGSPLLSADGASEKAWLGMGQRFAWLWNMYMNRLENKATKKENKKNKKKKKKKKKKPRVYHIERELTPSQSPARAKGMLGLFKKERARANVDVVIAGHTHAARAFKGWYYNSGCWIGTKQDYIRIQPNGQIDLLEWK